MSFKELQMLCHTKSVNNGWWQGTPNIPEKIALIHSEVSEALEGYRKDLPDAHIPHRSSMEVELADAIIRIFDLAGYLSLDLDGAIMEKLRYNDQREDHKLENRNKPGGKKF
jgi:NTP pyrophosphatase (non-canonical NTP hydrolase)